MINKKKLFMLAAALLLFLGSFALTAGHPWELRAGLSVIATGIFLWVTEPIPMPLTALLIISTLAALRAVPIEDALTGFSSGALFLILAGLIMAEGVNSTSLVKRFSYFILIRFGCKVKNSILAILVILQVIAFFIPAIAVKAALLLPIVLTINQSLPVEAINANKSLLLSVAFGVSITSVGLLPAALANVIAADLVSEFTGQPLTYFQWMIYNLPLSIVLIPVAWQLLIIAFPPEADFLPGGKEKMQKELEELGPLTAREKRCLAILFFTILLWMTEGLHGLHPSVPALLAAVLMGLPFIGIADWESLSRINWGTVILAGTNLSLGKVLIVTGISAFLAERLFPASFVSSVLGHPFTAVLFLAVFTHLYHLVIGNVATLVISILPVILELSRHMAYSPMQLGFIVATSALCGYILVVETLPNIIVYTSGRLTQADFVRAGIPLTLATIIALVLLALAWWPLARHLV